MSQSNTIALLDANVLYSAPLRDIFMQVALTGLFRVKWTETIHDEWITALLRTHPHLDRQRYERTCEFMNQALPDSNVTDYESWIPKIQLPDPDDRHVLAAAIVGKCEVIVTYNLSDFPSETLGVFGITTQAPDDFFVVHLQSNPEKFCFALKIIRTRLKNPFFSVEMYLSTLLKLHLKKTVKLLQGYVEWL